MLYCPESSLRNVTVCAFVQNLNKRPSITIKYIYDILYMPSHQ